MRIPTILKRTRFLIVLLAAVWLTGTCGSAYADTFSFSYSFPVFGGTADNPGSGDQIGLVAASGLMTGDLAPGQDYYVITDISGSRDYLGTSEQIAGLIDPDGFASNDNRLYMTGTAFLTGLGISFTVNGAGDDGLGNVNVFYVGDGEPDYTEALFTLDDVSLPAQAGNGPFTASDISGDVPEPSTIVLLGLGLAVIAFRKFRR
jgi:hypothetical protein